MAEPRSERYWAALDVYRALFTIPTARNAGPEVVLAAYDAARETAAKFTSGLAAKKDNADEVVALVRSIQETLRTETRRMEVGYESAFIDLVQRQCRRL